MSIDGGRVLVPGEGTDDIGNSDPVVDEIYAKLGHTPEADRLAEVRRGQVERARALGLRRF